MHKSVLWGTFLWLRNKKESDARHVVIAHEVLVDACRLQRGGNVFVPVGRDEQDAVQVARILRTAVEVAEQDSACNAVLLDGELFEKVAETLSEGGGLGALEELTTVFVQLDGVGVYDGDALELRIAVLAYNLAQALGGGRAVAQDALGHFRLDFLDVNVHCHRRI